MDELFQGFARIGCFHEGFADEETAEAGGTQAADGFGVGDAAFGDKERGCRSVGGFAQLPGYPEGVFYIGDEGAEVAVVGDFGLREEVPVTHLGYGITF